MADLANFDAIKGVDAGDLLELGGDDGEHCVEDVGEHAPRTLPARKPQCTRDGNRGRGWRGAREKREVRGKREVREVRE
eukprot:3471189-Rhodomonas_salina.2